MVYVYKKLHNLVVKNIATSYIEKKIKKALGMYLHTSFLYYPYFFFIDIPLMYLVYISWLYFSISLFSLIIILRNYLQCNGSICMSHGAMQSRKFLLFIALGIYCIVTSLFILCMIHT